MTKLAVCGIALCLAGCLRVAPVGLGGDRPPGESEGSPEAANVQGTSSDSPGGADAHVGAGTESDAGSDGEDEDDESDTDDGQDDPEDEQADDEAADAPEGAQDSS